MLGSRQDNMAPSYEQEDSVIRFFAPDDSSDYEEEYLYLLNPVPDRPSENQLAQISPVLPADLSCLNCPCWTGSAKYRDLPRPTGETGNCKHSAATHLTPSQ